MRNHEDEVTGCVRHRTVSPSLVGLRKPRARSSGVVHGLIGALDTQGPAEVEAPGAKLGPRLNWPARAAAHRVGTGLSTVESLGHVTTRRSAAGEPIGRARRPEETTSAPTSLVGTVRWGSGPPRRRGR